MEERRSAIEARERTRRHLGWQLVAASLIFILFGVPLYLIMWQHWTLITDVLLILFVCFVAYLIALMGLHIRARWLSIKVYKPLEQPRFGVPVAKAAKAERYIPAYEESYHDDYTDDWEA